MKITFIHLGLAILLFAIPLSHGVAQTPSTVFTYQGNLKHSDAAVSGSYDFEFRLFDAPAGGSQVGNALAVDSVVVDDGLFNLPLDFGNVFSGQNFWLEVQLRPSGAGSYVLLNPRQAITPAPHATYATTAGQAMNGVPAGFSILGNSKTPPDGFSWGGQRLSSIPAQWEYKAQSPDGATNIMGAAIGGKFYALGANQTIAVYDPVIDKWDETLTPSPVDGSLDCSMVAVGESIYFVVWADSMNQSDNQLLVYKPSLDSWNSLPMPVDGKGVLAALDEKFYVIKSTSTHVYDPVTETWSEAEAQPGGYGAAQGIEVNGKLYTFSYANGAAFVYDPAADDGPGGNTAWTAIASGLIDRNNYALVAFENKVHVLGGVRHNNMVAIHEIYDPETDSRSVGLPMQSERYGFAAAAIDGRIYVTGPGIITSLEQFTPGQQGYFVHIKD